MSSFSAKGSPTWTDGPLATGPGRRTSRWRGRTPRRCRRGPSRSRRGRRGCPGRRAEAWVSIRSSSRPIAMTLTSGLPWYVGSKTSSPPTVGRRRSCHSRRRRARRRRRGGASGRRRVAEAQRVEDRDRAGAHREDVAQDAADAGRGALVRLHGRRVVVALDLERDREPVADRDHAGLLPGPATTSLPVVGSVRSSGRELLYEQCSLHMTLNIASSRPFGSRAELVVDRVQLDVGEAERPVERAPPRARLGGGGHRARPRPASRTGHCAGRRSTPRRSRRASG